ncbi:MAG: conserved phage C-terminal domain-containing protein [Paenisporosarcina sp.]
MAKFRLIHTSFWEDARVSEDMTPEDKFFYMYLMTNPNTTQIGIYQITKKKIAFETGYSIETITSLMDRFENFHKLIKYNKETREIALLNWPKFNLVRGGKPMLDCVRVELAVVKDIGLISDLIVSVPNEDIKKLFSAYAPLPFDDTYHDTSTTRGQDKEEEEEEEEEEEILSGKPNVPSIPYSEIVDYLNLKANTNFRSSSKNTQKHIRARWKESYRLEDFQRVIDLKVLQWQNDSKMVAYLRPDTLFGTKFESYLNEKVVQPNGETRRYYGGPPTASAEDVLRDAEQRRQAWGG